MSPQPKAPWITGLGLFLKAYYILIESNIVFDDVIRCKFTDLLLQFAEMQECLDNAH